MEELRGVEKWEHMGRELFGQSIPEYPYQYSAGDIRSMFSADGDCLRETINQWLKHSASSTTWGHIIVALKTVNESHLADNLKAKFIPGELTTTTSSQYSLESQHEECILLYLNGQLLCWEQLYEIRHTGLTHLAKKRDNS